MAKSKARIPEDLQRWIEARKRFGLSHAHVQMARELGMNPRKLGKLANHDQEPWKAPLPIFIESLYEERFGKTRPDLVVPLEKRAKQIAAKKAERKQEKLRRRTAERTAGVALASAQVDAQTVAKSPPALPHGEVIRPLSGVAEAEECARLMSTSDPWMTFGRGFETSLRAVQNPAREVYVAMHGERVGGFLILNMKGAFVGYIQTVCVAPELRGQGLGTRLLRWAEARIFRDGPNVFMCVSSFNGGARRLYKRLGYKVVGELKNYLVSGHDEILLRKTLGPRAAFAPPAAPLEPAAPSSGAGSMQLPRSATLILIDVQKAIDHPSWGRRNNPQAETNMARLLEAWRRTSRPIVHVRHVSREPGSTYRPHQPGADFKDEVQPRAGEAVLEKSTNSAFIGTDLEARLRDGGAGMLVLAGVVTNNCVEATARMAGNLGFETVVVSDATAAFDKRDYSGVLRRAEDLHAMSLANLQGEYAAILDTAGVLDRCGPI